MSAVNTGQNRHAEKSGMDRCKGVTRAERSGHGAILKRRG